MCKCLNYFVCCCRFRKRKQHVPHSQTNRTNINDVYLASSPSESELRQIQDVKYLIENRNDFRVLCQSFTFYLDDIHSKENFLCCIAIAEWNENPSREIFVSIFNNFIKSRAIFEVNIDSNMRNILETIYLKTARLNFTNEIDDAYLANLYELTRDLKIIYQQLIDEMNLELWPEYLKIYKELEKN